MSQGGARFIVIEGLDAAGTSTQCQRLVNYLQRSPSISKDSPSGAPAGARAILTKEPTGGPAGAMIRLALAHRLKGPNLSHKSDRPAGSELDDHTMALLFAADRMDHVSAVIRPSLERGIHVVSDRYLMSTLAYQGLTLPREWILQINQHAIQPDLTIYLDAEVALTQHRMKDSRLDQELFESAQKQSLIQASFHEVLSAKYPQLGQVVMVNAKRPPEAVERSIRHHVDRLLGRKEVQEEEVPSLF